MTSSGATAAMPASTVLPGPALGLLTTLQVVPSQCSVSGREMPVTICPPAAQASSAARTVTSPNTLPPPPGSALGIAVHAVPSQCTASV